MTCTPANVSVPVSRTRGWWLWCLLSMYAAANAMVFSYEQLSRGWLVWTTWALAIFSLAAYGPYPLVSEAARVVAGGAVAGSLLLAQLDFGDGVASRKEGSQLVVIGFFLAAELMGAQLATATLRHVEVRRRQSAREARWQLEDERHDQILATLERSVPRPHGLGFLPIAMLGIGVLLGRRRRSN